MLRTMLGEPRRKDAGALLAANQAIYAYLQMLDTIPTAERNPQERRYNIWGRSFLRAVDELEQSQYAAIRFGNGVNRVYIDEMSEDERDDYHRHLYFYKNAIVRMFAILDKMGHFMNERFRLRTEDVKKRFSYFTVLRNMHDNRLYAEVEEQLFELKNKYEEPVKRLRTARNMEIHTIDADLLDDLINAAESLHSQQRIRTENIKEQLSDLGFGCEMAFTAVHILFSYLHKLAHTGSGK
ncbi:Cthe_2314 family HEPN domain-containing protein [Paenibacillus xerothermodurans]|uniref:Cthe-2314-like HEPN domain-containing protein n=1 Tax=Paenibacillus xerothermodurans TaxID=1977292 RepID=A0A2W1NDV5_PAEXE|nr:Cthe_2314 family HEPN domain-containing protein [Paenibacillus xerothermodurans]PZE21301.1 hypothetical protein CBW46_008010 [Paenibacillus xerothermodurans]